MSVQAETMIRHPKVSYFTEIKNTTFSLDQEEEGGHSCQLQKKSIAFQLFPPKPVQSAWITVLQEADDFPFLYGR